MMGAIVIDARDAAGPLLRGWGRYARELVSALGAQASPELLARATALPETGGDAAAYFDPADPGDLARRLSALLADDAARADLARRGVEHVRGFSWARTAAQTAAVYRELL